MWIRTSSDIIKCITIDIVTPVTGQFHTIDGLEVVRPRLRKLSCHSAHLNDGHLASKHEDDAHLEEDTEGVTDIVGVELLEAFGAVATLQEEGAAQRSLGKAFLKAAALAREDKRREALQALQDGLELAMVGILRKLNGGFLFPGRWGPGGRRRRWWRLDPQRL